MFSDMVTAFDAFSGDPMLGPATIQLSWTLASDSKTVSEYPVGQR
jgi:hypothetical protein